MKIFLSAVSSQFKAARDALELTCINVWILRNVLAKGGAFAKNSAGTRMFARRSSGFRRLGAQPHDRSPIGGTSENRFGMSGRAAGQHGGPQLEVRPNTVIDWRRRFAAEGIAGLRDRPRSGKPPRYTGEFRKQVLATLEEPPPQGQAVWDGPALAEHLKTSVHAVWRVLRKEGVCLARQRSWCVSTDPEFTAKAADVVGLYLNPPQNALVLSVEEKPSIQALERKTGFVETDSGKIVRGFKST